MGNKIVYTKKNNYGFHPSNMHHKSFNADLMLHFSWPLYAPLTLLS